MPGAAFLRGADLALHTVTEEDYHYLRRHLNAESIHRWLGGNTPLDDAAVADWFEDDDSVHFLPCRDGEPVGHAWLFRTNEQAGRAEIGYWIAPEHQGEGYGTEAARLCVDYAFDDLHCHRVMARVYEGNEGSRRIVEGLGFEREGLLREHGYAMGGYADAEVFGVLEREWRGTE